METETEIKEQQWTKSISSASSSRSSSITSDSSDGHFDIRHFPLPKPSLSASEVQKQRDSHQNYNSSVSSYTGSSWSHLVDSSGYDPNRIPSSVFSSKPANTADWSIASNESLFSIHDGNFCISTREDHGFGRLSEIPKFEETVHEITEINPAPLPPVNKPKESEKETITEISDSENDDNDEEREMIELESDAEHEEEDEDEDMIKEEVLVEIETEKTKEKTEVVKESKPEDSSSVISHSPSISCRSDTSTNSIGSFAFPLLQKEDEVTKTPSMEIKANISLKRKPEYKLPQSPMRPPQPQPHSESSMVTELQPQSQPQRKASEKSESQTQSPKASKSGWFSCFKFPSKCNLFK
ncbi:hypothetical protein V5N11_023378 [Cardamine amara subsp. amara]|uniref:Uncharacterized protein n=1 Tax=Cardamine amara subsp. amara TaxID=228776 RepID=A0ABD1AXT8_CARAN